LRVFISSQAVDSKNVQDIIHAIRSTGIEVEHSPRNPIHGEYPRWTDWYSSGLATTIIGCDLLVIIIDLGWDSSTWMGIEAEAWRARWAGQLPHAFYWNPQSISVGIGMTHYLKEELPKELNAAVKRIAMENGAALNK
jgi:lipoate-protein ligase A